MRQPEGYEPLLGSVPVTDEELGAQPSSRVRTSSYQPTAPIPFHSNNHYNQDLDDLLGRDEDADITWATAHNLDAFFTQLYRYWEEKGFVVILVARILNLAALAFTIFSSGVLLLGIDYSQLNAECIKQDACNLWDVALIKHPLSGPLSLRKVLSIIYLVLFIGYWIFAVLHLLYEVRGLEEVRQFFATQVGLSERSLRSATWPEVAARLVAAQKSVRLSIVRDLNEHDIVSRIMRRDNYLIGMLHQGVLALNIPIPGLHRHVLLTKTVEWNLRWCVLDPMIDDGTFKLRPSFIQDEIALERRFRIMAVINAMLSPFVLVFLIIYFFMRNAEEMYHHPSSIGARRWSPAALWGLREFNELPHFVRQRFNAGSTAAASYVAQFPNHALSHIGRFVAFVTGSFAAVLIALTLVDERLLERDLVWGRQTVWWLALLGIILAIARALIIEPTTSAFDPELVLLEVAAHTHHLPRHWRGAAHTLEVQEEFQELFRYRASLLLEELLSVLLTPVLLWFTLPRSSRAILAYIRENTVNINGVGDVCVHAAFYHRAAWGGGGSGGSSDRDNSDNSDDDIKMEKSVVSFAATYPTWNPPKPIEGFLSSLAASSLSENRVSDTDAEKKKFQNGSAPPVVREGLVYDEDVDMMESMIGRTAHALRTRDHAMADPFVRVLASRYPRFAEMYMYTPNSDNSRYINYNIWHNGRLRNSMLSSQEERVAVAHSMLQSYYEKNDRRKVVHDNNTGNNINNGNYLPSSPVSCKGPPRVQCDERNLGSFQATPRSLVNRPQSGSPFSSSSPYAALNPTVAMGNSFSNGPIREKSSELSILTTGYNNSSNNNDTKS